MLEVLLTSPAIAGLLIVVLLVEAIALFTVWKTHRTGLPPTQIISFLGAGLAFALALACVLANLSYEWFALSLLAAFVFHLADLYLRWQK